jgi:hypothetical protein
MPISTIERLSRAAEISVSCGVPAGAGEAVSDI